MGSKINKKHYINRASLSNRNALTSKTSNILDLNMTFTRYTTTLSVVQNRYNGYPLYIAKIKTEKKKESADAGNFGASY